TASLALPRPVQYVRQSRLSLFAVRARRGGGLRVLRLSFDEGEIGDRALPGPHGEALTWHPAPGRSRSLPTSSAARPPARSASPSTSCSAIRHATGWCVIAER